MMGWKKGIGIMLRCIAFVLVFSMFFSHTTNLLMRHDDESNEIHAFYGEPEDSIDVLYIGSSPLSAMGFWRNPCGNSRRRLLFCCAIIFFWNMTIRNGRAICAAGWTV